MGYQSKIFILLFSSRKKELKASYLITDADSNNSNFVSEMTSDSLNISQSLGSLDPTPESKSQGKVSAM